MRILLVEDDPALASSVARLLVRHGYIVDVVASLGDAVAATLGESYRAVLLDRRLPDGDGLALIPILRTRPNAPAALVLTALDDIPDRVAGLDAGAEDYLIKPYAPEELLARLRVMLRRRGESARAPTVSVGQLTYDPGTRETRVGGRSLVVPRRELAVLDALLRRAGRVVTRERLEADVYGYDDEVGPNALEAQVSRLRRRLAQESAAVTIHVVRGVGYMLAAT